MTLAADKTHSNPISLALKIFTPKDARAEHLNKFSLMKAPQPQPIPSAPPAPLAAQQPLDLETLHELVNALIAARKKFDYPGMTATLEVMKGIYLENPTASIINLINAVDTKFNSSYLINKFY